MPGGIECGEVLGEDGGGGGMKMYRPELLGLSPQVLAESGVLKAFAMRRGLLCLKHEVKDLLKAGVRDVDTQRLNERLQHIAKIPRPGGLLRQKCGKHCQCARGLK